MEKKEEEYLMEFALTKQINRKTQLTKPKQTAAMEITLKFLSLLRRSFSSCFYVLGLKSLWETEC